MKKKSVNNKKVKIIKTADGKTIKIHLKPDSRKRVISIKGGVVTRKPKVNLKLNK